MTLDVNKMTLGRLEQNIRYSCQKSHQKDAAPDELRRAKIKKKKKVAPK